MDEAEDGAEKRAALLERIGAVRARFLASLESRAGELARLAERAAGSDAADAASARADLRRGLHNLAGAAPTIGLVGIGRAAAALEAIVIAAPEGPLERSAALSLAAEIARLREHGAANQTIA